MVQNNKIRYQLPLQTADFTAAFMIWVIISSLLPFIKVDIELSTEMTAWVTAIPVVLGSILRIPFGYLTGRFGARPVYLVSFCILIIPIVFISQAQYAHELIIGGTILGIAGAIFSVGVTSLPKYYPKQRQGFVNGVYGLGNIGTALSAFGAPPLAVAFGWQTTVLLYLVPVLVIVILNLILGDRHEETLATPVISQITSISTSKYLWAYSLFYFITFGAFVALFMLLPNFLSVNYGLDGVSSGIAMGIFVVIAACLRIVGGWLADRFSPYAFLIAVFGCMIVGAAFIAALPALPLFLAGIYLIGICCGIGNGVVFKLVPSTFPKQIGIANGVVAMMGGLGGFFPPHILSFFFTNTGSYFPAFLLFIFCIVACLIVVGVLSKSRTTQNP